MARWILAAGIYQLAESSDRSWCGLFNLHEGCGGASELWGRIGYCIKFGMAAPYGELVRKGLKLKYGNQKNDMG